jgi:hypothetical protein
VSFSKTSNSTHPSDSCYFEVFEKLTRACYIQIALETMLILISNNMTRGKLAIKFPDAGGRFVKVQGRSPRTFTNLPEASGNLIANFPTSHVISL